MKKSDSMTNNEIALTSNNFEDIDEQSDSLAGHDQEYQQLSCGQFRGQFSSLLLGSGVALYFEKLNQVVEQYGSIPEGWYSVILLPNKYRSSNNHTPNKMNGRDFSADSLFLGGGGSSFYGINQPGTDVCVVTVEKKYLHGVNGETGDSIAGFENGRETIHVNRQHAHALRQLVAQTVAITQDTPKILHHSAALSGLRSSISEMVSNLFTDTVATDFSAELSERADRYLIMRNARDYIHGKVGDDISIARLCCDLEVKRRTLEYSFQVCLGQSPAAYLRVVRLNAIRRALCLSENSDQLIGDIVAKYGIWHLSRFAQHYQNQFGELPSETHKHISKNQ